VNAYFLDSSLTIGFVSILMFRNLKKSNPSKLIPNKMAKIETTNDRILEKGARERNSIFTVKPRSKAEETKPIPNVITCNKLCLNFVVSPTV
jgi:hypothetical protein